MVTVPGFVGCWKCRWLPVCRTECQPSASTSLIASRTFTAPDDEALSVTCDAGFASEVRAVLAEDVLHRAADLAHRGAVAQGVLDEGQEVLGALGRVAQLFQASLDLLLVAVGLEPLEPLDLLVFGLGVDAQDVLDDEVLLDELVDADHDVLLDAV